MLRPPSHLVLHLVAYSLPKTWHDVGLIGPPILEYKRHQQPKCKKFTWKTLEVEIVAVPSVHIKSLRYRASPIHGFRPPLPSYIQHGFADYEYVAAQTLHRFTGIRAYHYTCERLPTVLIRWRIVSLRLLDWKEEQQQQRRIVRRL